MNDRPTTADDIAEALSAPFPTEAIKFRPGATAGNRALALPYVDARAIMDRLDDVLGVSGWQDEYTFLEDGSALCRLTLFIEQQWISKMDIGGQSEQPDEGDRRKAACSDALKRAAVKFGVGRYLYRLPQQWCDYDPQKKRFTHTPALPVSKGRQKPQEGPQEPPGSLPEDPAIQNPIRRRVLPGLKAAAAKGVEAIRAAWLRLTDEEKEAVKVDIPHLQAQANTPPEENP
jgi:hypothetical protein